MLFRSPRPHQHVASRLTKGFEYRLLLLTPHPPHRSGLSWHLHVTPHPTHAPAWSNDFYLPELLATGSFRARPPAPRPPPAEPARRNGSGARCRTTAGGTLLLLALLQEFYRLAFRDELTGLPEYRNGGLLLDSGVLRLRDPQWADRTWTPADELIVEWRGLTVALLDELAERVQTELGTRLPLACVLEGGTWAAGRALAQQLRDGLPPLTIRSDGTVF